MSNIRVDPASIRNYADRANEQFAAGRTDLQALVDAAVGVHYFGLNATTFKQDCGNLAKSFADALLLDFKQMADAVQASTTNIAGSLGGSPIILAVEGTSIATPTVPVATAADAVDVNLPALQDLTTVVTRHLGAVRSAMNDHLATLKGTDWQGTAKASAESAVSALTTQVNQKAQEAETQINRFITDQISAVQQADR